MEISESRMERVKGGLKVIDCIVLSAEYWCPNGTRLAKFAQH